MERQVYPTRLAPDGSAEPPYDVAGWTLPLLMGVEVAEVADRFDAPSEAVDRIEPIRSKLTGEKEPKSYVIDKRSNYDFIVLNALLESGAKIGVAERRDARGARPIVVEANEEARKAIEKVLPTVSTVISGESDDPSARRLLPVKPQRIGVYQPWQPSMDEGWTRLVLEKFQFPYATLHNDDIRAGRLKDRIDTLVLPSIGGATFRNGYARDETEPRYVGGLGGEGIDAIRAFVESGGTLVCLEESCRFAIEELGLPVREVTRGLKTSEFYGPGSILAARVASEQPVTFGVPDDLSVYFERSLAFDADESKGARVLVRYAKTGLLRSGWLLGPEKIQDKAALVEVPLGQGRVVLFGFPPQFRGQTHGTFRLLFNALLRGGIGSS
jgi:hypothetical protein